MNDNQTFTETLKSMPWTFHFHWMGKDGIVKLDNDRIAMVRITTHGRADQWQAIDVSVVSKTRGEIATKRFQFMDHMDLSEDAASHANAKNVKLFYIWRTGEWYIRRPNGKAQRRFCEAIETWIGLFT